MSAHRTHSSAWLADLTAHQMHINDLLNSTDCIFVLRQPHTPASNRALGMDHYFSRLPNLLSLYAACFDNFVPTLGF